MKKRKLIIGLLIWLISLPSFAEVYEGTCGGQVRYSLDTGTSVLTLTGEGRIIALPWDNHKKSIKKIVADDEIEFPFNNWLLGCDSIISPQYNGRTFIYMPRNYKEGAWYNYTVPVGIKEIAPFAFSGCNRLQSVGVVWGCEKIGQNAFLNCKGLSKVSLPIALVEIGNYAFYNCTALAAIKMPNTITKEVPYDCFHGCTSLINGVYNDHCFYYLPPNVTGDFEIPGSPERIASYAFQNGQISSVKIPSSVKVIGESAFSRCSNLVNIVLPDGLQTIQRSAFSDCPSLLEVSIPEGVDSIPEYVFNNCKSLSTVALPDQLEYIGNDAFCDCENLRQINFPDAVKEVGTHAFTRCDKLLEPLYNRTIFAKLPVGYQGNYAISDGITIIASSAFFNCQGLTGLDIPNSVNRIGIGAFYSCQGLTTVNIPDGVKQIDAGAFSDCSNLIQVDLPDGITYLSDELFYNCTNLQNASIPGQTTHIGNRAFQGCAAIVEAKIPSSVGYIGDEAFADCTALSGVILPEKVDTIGVNIFGKCTNLNTTLVIGKTFIKCPYTARSFVVPEGIEQIASYAFQNCEELYKVQLPQSVESIGEHAFEWCASLYEMDLPEKIDTIGQYAFNGCESLGSIHVPETVRFIAPYTFIGCAKLSDVQLPKQLVGIGNCAFSNCKSLLNIVFPESLSMLGSSVFEGCAQLSSVTLPGQIKDLESGIFINCVGLKSITLPEHLVSIGSSTFKGCSSLVEMDIPVSVTSIGGSAFESCTNLKSIILPASMTSIGGSAFKSCTGLESIVLPDFITSIYYATFMDCVKLSRVSLPNNLKTLGEDVFFGCSSLSDIHIPAALIDISIYAFNRCASLASISVENGNPNYSSYYGLLCDKEQTQVIIAPIGIVDVVIPPTVKELTNLSKYGFLSECTRIRSLALPFIGKTKNSTGKEGFLGYIFDSWGSYAGQRTETDSSGKKWTISKYESKIPLTLKKLTLYCDTLYTQQLSYAKVISSYNKEEYVTSGLDQLDTLIVYADTDIDTKLIKKFKSLKHLELNHVKTMEEGFLAELTNLESLTLPYAGVGSITTAGNFGALFSTVTNSEMRRVVQKLEDGTSQTYYLPIGLQSLVLTEGCETLPYGAFYGCYPLKNITLPSTLYMVSEETFYGCAGLTDIYCKGASPASAFSNSFEGVRTGTCKLHVPHSASEVYKRSTGWKSFFYIEEEAPITIAVTKNIENAGVIYGMNEYQLGETAELKAVAHSGYIFSAWTEDGIVMSEEETYMFVVKGNRNLVAVFIPVNDKNGVEIDAGSSEVYFTWEAEEDAAYYQLNVYRDMERTELTGSLLFDAKGNPIRKRSIMLNATIDGLEASTEYYYSMTAYDEADQVISQYAGTFKTKNTVGVEDVLQGQDEVTVRAATGYVMVTGAVGNVISVFTLSGQLLIQETAESDMEEITLGKGFYLVKVESRSYKIVVK